MPLMSWQTKFQWKTFFMINSWCWFVLLLSYRNTAFSRRSLIRLLPRRLHTTSYSVCHTTRWECRVRWVSLNRLHFSPCTVPHVVWRRLEIIQPSYRVFLLFSSFLTWQFFIYSSCWDLGNERWNGVLNSQ